MLLQITNYSRSSFICDCKRGTTGLLISTARESGKDAVDAGGESDLARVLSVGPKKGYGSCKNSVEEEFMCQTLYVILKSSPSMFLAWMYKPLLLVPLIIL